MTIVKVCKVHGELDESMVIIENRKQNKSGVSVRCAQCRVEKRILASKSLKKNCDKHGELDAKDISISGDGYLCCRICQRATANKKRNNNRAWFNEKTAEDKKLNPEKWAAHYKREYEAKKKKHGVLLSLLKVCQSRGITIDDYNRMLEEQNGKCKICKQEETCKDPKHDRVRRLNIDHCHTTNKVRGLLCNDCNTSLGKFKDDISILESAIEYLKKYRE